MKNFNLQSKNQFDEKVKEFENSKLAERLQAKYEPKSYEVRNKPVYFVALISSYAANIFSIITAFSFVFAYIFAIVADLPFPSFFSLTITLFVLVLIEFLQRYLAPSLIANIFQFGMSKTHFLTIGAIACLSLTSIYFSFNGGFDLPKMVQASPTYTAPPLQDVEQIRKDYLPLIESADSDAKSYQQAKLYRSRLSDSHAKAYKQLIEKKQKLQSEMVAKIANVEQLNREAVEASKTDHADAVTEHSNKLQSTGNGLANLAIFAQLIFFLSVYFMERYDWKTICQYAKIEGNESAAGGQVPTDKNPPNAATPKPVFSANKTDPESGLSANYKIDDSKSELGKPKSPHEKEPKPQDLEPKREQTKNPNENKRTIDYKNAKGVVVQYDFQRVEGLIRKYQNRVNEAAKKAVTSPRAKKALANNKRWLEYWKTRIFEFEK